MTNKRVSLYHYRLVFVSSHALHIMEKLNVLVLSARGSDALGGWGPLLRSVRPSASLAADAEQ
mgnify:FL=1